ncbi:MAG: J domain-containing protein [Candidatus Woesearchaeota archaeon]|nr:J domain-containing protein [Candidatus Woesearchaeota archaeon]
MATKENPLSKFPFSKGQLEVLLVNGTLVDAAKKYYRNAARLLHPDQGGKDFVDYGLPADGVFKVLNGAYQEIEAADAAQLESWVNSYGNGGGIPEEQVARILAGAQILKDRLAVAETEKGDLERKLLDLVRAAATGAGISERRIQELLASKGGDPAKVRELEARVEVAERERDKNRTLYNAAVRDGDIARAERATARRQADKNLADAEIYRTRAEGLEPALKTARAAEARIQAEYTQAVEAATNQIRRLGEETSALRQGLKEAVRPDVGETPHLLAHLLVYELLRAGAVPSPAYRGAFIRGARAYGSGAYGDARQHLAPFLKSESADDAVGVYLFGMVVDAQNQGPDGKPLNAGAAKWAAGLKYYARKKDATIEEKLQALATPVPIEYYPFFMRGLAAFMEGDYPEAKKQLTIFRGSGRGGIDSAAGMYLLGEVISAESSTEGNRKYGAGLKYRAKRLDGQVEAKMSVFLAPPKAD